MSGRFTVRPVRMRDGIGALHWSVALLTAALGGGLLRLSLPEPGWWFAALLGAVLVFAGLWQQRLGVGALAGAVAGGAFWLPGISWLTLYLGPVPWLGLSAVMMLWYVLFGMAVAVATRGIGILRIRLLGRGAVWAARCAVSSQALVAAALWVLREQVQSTWPYGGFAWGRLAHSQADGPLAAAVSWVGFSGLSGLLALGCAIPVAMLAARRQGTRRWALAARAAGGALTAAALFAALALVPAASLPVEGTLRIAAVQGNSKSGIFDDRENGDVFRVHVEETERLLDELEARGESVDVIVWPENSAEFALPDQVYRARTVARLAERAGAPIVVGTILQDPDGTYTNSMLVFDGSGDTGVRYDKRRPVPFAEYMPNRAFYRSLAPELVDLVQLEYAHGTRPAVVDIDGASGEFAAALAICFDIIFDDHAVAMAEDNGRAGVIFAPSNNADFGRTEESAQQLQIARLRAIESGRALVNISTVGTSAVVLPDGTDADRIATHTPDSLIAAVPLVSGLTPALRWGAAICAVWVAIGVLGLAVGVSVSAGAGARLSRASGDPDPAASGR